MHRASKIEMQVRQHNSEESFTSKTIETCTDYMGRFMRGQWGMMSMKLMKPRDKETIRGRMDEARSGTIDSPDIHAQALF